MFYTPAIKTAMSARTVYANSSKIAVKEYLKNMLPLLLNALCNFSRVIPKQILHSENNVIFIDVTYIDTTKLLMFIFADVSKFSAFPLCSIL